MTRAQIYKPAPRWPTFAALVGALTLDFTALAVASFHQEEAPVVPGLTPSKPIEAEFVVVPPEVTPPEANPPPLPPPPDLPPEFALSDPIPLVQPPRKPRHDRAVASTTAQSVPAPAARGSAQISLTNAPRPAYPYEARRAHQTGSGRFLLHFAPDGTVADVVVDRITGSAVLDQVAADTFHRWRSRPGACATLCVPVTFTLAGAQL